MDQPHDLFTLDLRRPWLIARFPDPQRVLSWALARPGFQRAGRIAWLEVSEAELPAGLDAGALLDVRLAAEGLGDAVAMMTSRNVGHVHRAAAVRGGLAADCAATVGLANAVRIGAAPGAEPHRLGTINLLAAVSRPLTDAALVEAISIAAEARTAAVIDARLQLPAGLATGTGTDCIAVAAPDGPDPLPFCGLHTQAGQALGAAVYDAVLAGAQHWMAERGR